MIKARAFFLLLCILRASAALAAGASWLPSGPPQITGVALSNSYFVGTLSPGATVGVLTVLTTGAPFGGSLTLGGPAAASFALSGNNLNAAATLTAGIDYSITVTPTGASPTAFHIYAGVDRYMSPTGNDANSGTSTGSPWKSVNHPLHCADVLHAATGTYLPINFGATFWGAVACPANDNVAWVKCSGTLASCLVIGDYNNQGAISPDQSYWGVQGFEAQDNASPYGGCFALYPRFSTITVHHVVFANDVANGCPLAGFDSAEWSGATGPSSVDYIMMVGNLSWNGARSSVLCGSGISLASLAQADNAPGAHIYVALNVISQSINGNNCASSGLTTDGEGMIIDRADINHFQSLVVVENNLWLGNGSAGFETNGGAPPPVIYRNNTGYGNMVGPQTCAFTVGDIYAQNGGILAATNNILFVTQSNNCGTFTNWPVENQSLLPPSLIDGNWMFNAGSIPGNIQINWGASVIKCNDGTTLPISPGTGNNTYICGANTVANPLFAAPSIPGQWFCSGFADTQACAASVIAGFTPSASGSTSKGFTALAPTDANNSTPFFKNILHALPAALNPHGF